MANITYNKGKANLSNPTKLNLGAISDRPARRAGGVRKRGESRQQMQQRLGQYGAPTDNSDIDAIFRGIQSTKGPLRRDLSGSIEDPNKLNGLDAFFAKNPHLQGAAERQAQFDEQAKANSQQNLMSAVAERKALQEMQEQNPNLVTGADGYRTIFDNSGRVIGTTKPIKSNAFWSQDKAINDGTATTAERQDFSNELQKAGMQSVNSQVMGPPVPKGIDHIFSTQSSPPGEATDARVGASRASGEPGGETSFRQLPRFSSIVMQPQQQAGFIDDTPEAWKAKTRQQYFPSGSMSEPQQNFVGPQLPQFSQDQQDMLRALFQPSFGLQQNNELASNPRIAFTDAFPGDDYQAIKQGFPELYRGSTWDVINQLRQLASHPAIYSSIFNR